MADINSPLGRRNLAAQGQPVNRRTVLTVPDESEMRASSSSYEDEQDLGDPMQHQALPDEEVVNPVYRHQRQVASHQVPHAQMAGHQHPMSPNMSRETLQKMRQEAKHSKMEVAPKAKNRIEVLLGLKRKTQEVEIDGVTFTLKTLKHVEFQEVFISLSKLTDATSFVISLELQIQSLARSITHIDGAPITTVLGVESVEEIISHLREFDSDVIEKLYNVFKNLKKETEVSSAEEKEVNEDLKK